MELIRCRLVLARVVGCEIAWVWGLPCKRQGINPRAEGPKPAELEVPGYGGRLLTGRKNAGTRTVRAD